MAARVYATLADLTSYAPSGTTLPVEPEATRVLTAASKVLERATLTAVYTTDTLSYPTDAVIRQAFRDAACAQVIWWGITLDEMGASGQWQTVSIGSVSLGRGKGVGAGQELAPAAHTELLVAGVLPGYVAQLQIWEGGGI